MFFKPLQYRESIASYFAFGMNVPAAEEEEMVNREFVMSWVGDVVGSTQARS